MSVGRLSSSWFPVSCARAEVHFLLDLISAEWTEPSLYKPQQEHGIGTFLCPGQGPPIQLIYLQKTLKDVGLKPKNKKKKSSSKTRLLEPCPLLCDWSKNITRHYLRHWTEGVF